MEAYTHRHTHTHIVTHTDTYIGTHTDIDIHTHRNTHIYTDTHTHTHTDTHIHTQTHRHIQIQTDTHIIKCLWRHSLGHGFSSLSIDFCSQLPLFYARWPCDRDTTQTCFPNSCFFERKIFQEVT